MRILFDTNVVLDLLLDRTPHALAAGLLISAVERKRLAGSLCATSVTTLDYLIAREIGRERSRSAIRTMLRLFDVAAVTRAVLQTALELEFEDYEDAVVHEAARAADAQGIVTRSMSDFRASALPVFSPEELVASLADS